MKKGKFLFLAAACAFSLTACDKDDDATDRGTEASNTQDVNFALQASFSNQAEVAMGNLAAQQATNTNVRTFGQRTVTEHTAAQNQLQTAAGNARLSITADTSSLGVMRQQLMMLSGRAFDSTYLRMQVDAHQATLTLLQAEATSGMAPSLKGYANAQIPGVQEHLRVADSLLRTL